MDDLLGFQVTDKVKTMFKGLKTSVSKGWTSYFKGVSAGGEEFTSKLDKLLIANSYVERPNFLRGTLKEVIASLDCKKPMLLYLSGGEDVSKTFETQILTQSDVIGTMVS